MATNPQGFDYTEFYRPVTDGGRAFLSQVDHCGEKIFGREVVTSMPQTVLVDSNAENGGIYQPEPASMQVAIGRPLVVTATPREMKMVLDERLRPADQKARYGMGHSLRGITREGRLSADLDEISIRHGQDPKNTVIKCDQVRLIRMPGKDRVLALLPDKRSELMLMEQSDLIASRVAEKARSLAYPEQPTLPHVPLARLPHDVTRNQYESLIDEIIQILPARLVLGGLKRIIND